MQTKNPILDEMAKAFESAMGLAQAAGEEAKTALRAQGDRMAAELDLVRRDELEAMRDTLMAEIASLRAEIARMAASTGGARPMDDAG
jgi:BMFP domain-containing protein YqiC